MRSHTVALGLGSNLKNPIQNLRRALNEIKKISELRVLNISSIYESDAQLPEISGSDWNQSFLNAVVLCEVKSSMNPSQLLKILKVIEIKLGRTQSEKWAPRMIDLDILLWDQTKFYDETLKIPHPQIKERPFVLLPLLEVWPDLPIEKPVWASPWILPKPFGTQKSQKYFWPQIVGILNVTEDSFSDGGQFNQPEELYAQAVRLLKTGAEILDVGGQSTRPGATAIEATEEKKRLHSALEVLSALKKDYQFEISLDCKNADVATEVLTRYSIDYLNDVTGFENHKMQKILKEFSKLKAFVMHSLGVPPTADAVLDESKSPCDQLNFWWQKKCEQLQFAQDRIIFDPGIGFGKTKWQSLFILNNLKSFSPITQPIMIAHSRKSFQTLFSDRPAAQRDLETALMTKNLDLTHVQYLRVHNAEITTMALRSSL